MASPYGASRTHSDTSHSVRLLWTSDQPVAETSTAQHTTLIIDKHPYPPRDSNSQSQQKRQQNHASDCAATPTGYCRTQPQQFRGGTKVNNEKYIWQTTENYTKRCGTEQRSVQTSPSETNSKYDFFLESCADCLEILGATTSWSPRGLSKPVMG